MHVELELGFDQLVQIAKKLPTNQWIKLKAEVDADPKTDQEREEFRKILLEGPVYTKKQLDTIAETRKAINQWRKN